MLHASFLIFPLYESIRVDPPSPPGHKIRFAVLDAVSSLLQLWCWTMGLRNLHPNGPDCMMCISFPLSASFPHSWVYFPPAFSAPVTSHLNNSTIFLLYGIICWYVSHGTNSHLMSRACSPDSILYLFVPAVLAMQGTTGRFISLKKKNIWGKITDSEVVWDSGTELYVHCSGEILVAEVWAIDVTVKETWVNPCLLIGMGMKKKYRNWQLSPGALSGFSVNGWS